MISCAVTVNPDPATPFVDDLFSSIGDFFEELFGGGGNTVNISLERALSGWARRHSRERWLTHTNCSSPRNEEQIPDPCFR